uniref:Uncharacterized protein n=1 Tax=Anopheles farauti TaxID=69004 RepID=A0A182QJN2_9DIPT
MPQRNARMRSACMTAISPFQCAIAARDIFSIRCPERYIAAPLTSRAGAFIAEWCGHAAHVFRCDRRRPRVRRRDMAACRKWFDVLHRSRASCASRSRTVRFKTITDLSKGLDLIWHRSYAQPYKPQTIGLLRTGSPKASEACDCILCCRIRPRNPLFSAAPIRIAVAENKTLRVGISDSDSHLAAFDCKPFLIALGHQSAVAAVAAFVVLAAALGAAAHILAHLPASFTRQGLGLTFTCKAWTPGEHEQYFVITGWMSRSDF